MQSFKLEHLDETQFEEFCYDLLHELGFINVKWRKGTALAASPADRGRDIECSFIREDLDGSREIEPWFVECKHYMKGVPPDKIQGALAWATAKRPHTLLIIVSGFLSNAAADYLTEYREANKPTFRIKVWERKDLERLTGQKINLLRKYHISTDVVEEPFWFIRDVIYGSSGPSCMYAVPIELQTNDMVFMHRWAVSSDGVFAIDGEELDLSSSTAYFGAGFLLLSSRHIVITKVMLTISDFQPSPPWEGFRLIADLASRDRGSGPVDGLNLQHIQIKKDQDSYQLKADDSFKLPNILSNLPYRLDANDSLRLSLTAHSSDMGLYTMHMVIEAEDYSGRNHRIITPNFYFRHLHVPIQVLHQMPIFVQNLE